MNAAHQDIQGERERQEARYTRKSPMIPSTIPTQAANAPSRQRLS